MKQDSKRAWSVFQVVKAETSDDGERIIEGIASTPSTDRVGDVVDPLGAKFSLPMPLLWQHNHSQPVGQVEFAKPTSDGIPFRARIAKIVEPGTLRDRVDEAWQSVKAGLVRGVSIGFRALEYAFVEGGGIHFTEWEWMELSLVTIPANSEATISTIKGFDTSGVPAFGKCAEKVKKVRAAPGACQHNARRAKAMSKKSISDQIEAFEETRRQKSSRMHEIIEEGGDETLDEAGQAEFDELEADISEIDAHIKRLRSVQKSEASTAEPVPVVNASKDASDSRSRIPATVKSPKPAPGIRFARYAKCIGLASKTQRSRIEVAESLYSQRDPELVAMMKASITAVSAGSDTALIGNEGGFADFVDFLRPQTIIGKFGQNNLPALRRVPFRIPLIAQTVGGQAYWVGEGSPKPLTRQEWDRAELSPLKIANIAVATMESLRDSSPAADMLIRDDLAAAVVEGEDLAFIDPSNAGAANVRPAAITNGIPSIPSSGGDGDAVREDARQAMQAFISAKNPLSSGVWVMSPTVALGLSLLTNALGQQEFPKINMLGGEFMMLPVIVSEHASDNVTLVNASDIYLADDGEVAVDMSTEASLQMLDNPTNSSTAPTPTTMVSMFQTNSVAFRAERTINWRKRRASAVAVISGVSWGASASA